MKILFFLTTLEKGGAETQCYNLIKSLCKQKKYSIKVVSLTGGFYEKELEKLEVEISIFSNKIHIFLPFYIFKLRNELKKFQPNIVHSFLFHSNIVLKFTLFTIKKNFKVIASYRSLISKYPLIKYLEKVNKNKVDLLISNSNAASNEVEYLQGKNNKRLVINNGIQKKSINKTNIKKIKNQYKNIKIILTIGNIRFEKDYKTNMLTCKELLKTRKDIVFLYAGDGVQLEEMKEFAKQNKLTKYVKFLGRRDDIEDLLTSCDIFFLPTLFESQPNVVLEAMMYKKPIVTTDILAINEINSKVKLTQVGDFKTMAKEIDDVLLKGFDKESIKENYENIQSNFSLQTMIKKHKIIYKNLSFK